MLECNSKHDWNLVKYLNIWHHNKTQKQLWFFFLKFGKKLANFLFRVLWKCLAFIKNWQSDLQKFWSWWTPYWNRFLTFFRDIVKTLETWTLSTLRTLDQPITMPLTFSWSFLLPCRKLWCSKSQLHISLLFTDIAKILKTCIFGYFGNAWPYT